MPDDYATNEPSSEPAAPIQLVFNEHGKKIFSRYITDLTKEVMTVVREGSNQYWVSSPKMEGLFAVLKNQVVPVSAPQPIPNPTPEPPITIPPEIPSAEQPGT